MKLKLLAIINSMVPIYIIYVLISYFSSKTFEHAQFHMNHSGNIASFYWLSAVVISLLSQIFSIILYYLIQKTNKKHRSLLFFSGFLFFPISLLKERFSIRKSNKKRGILFGFLISLIAIIFIPIIPLMVIGNENVYDKPFYSMYQRPPEFSVDEASPNYIEIFSDGLDWNYLKNSVNENKDEFKDYCFYPNYITPGFYTGPSFPWEFRISNNDANNPGYAWTEATSYAEKFKMKNVTDNFEQLNYYSSLGPHKPESYPRSWSSNEKYVSSIFKGVDVNMVNHEMANVLLGKPFGAYSPTYAPYEAFIKDARISESNKSSYSLLLDHITHIPAYTSTDGKASHFISTQMSFNLVAKFMDDLKNKLTHIEKDGKNAWDNTSVIIYGDHASHTTSQPKTGVDFSEHRWKTKNQSLLIVKPLKKFMPSAKLSDVKGNVVGATNVFTNNIDARFTQKIGDAIKDGVNPIEFINNNKNFGSGKLFATVFDDVWTNRRYLVTEIKDGKLSPVSDRELEDKGLGNDKYKSEITQNDFIKLREEFTWRT